MSSHLSTGRRRSVALALSRTVTAGLLGLGLATGAAMPALADAASVAEATPPASPAAPELAPQTAEDSSPQASPEPEVAAEPEPEPQGAGTPLSSEAERVTESPGAGDGTDAADEPERPDTADGEAEGTEDPQAQADPDTTAFVGSREAAAKPQSAKPEVGPQHAGPNQTPVAANDSYEMVQDTVLKLDAPGILGNDSDPDGDSFQLYDGTQPSPSGSLPINNANGRIWFEPESGFTGTVTFTYVVRDEHGAVSAPATVTIVVKPTGTPVEQPITTNDDQYFYAQNTPLYIAAPGVLGNDHLQGKPATVTIESLSNAADAGTFTLNSDGSFLFTPYPGALGMRWFTYRACGSFNCSIGQVILWPVSPGQDPSGPSEPANQAPFAANDTATVVEGQTVVASPPGVLANDSDPDGDPLTVVDYATPAHGSVVIFGDGSYSYMAESGYTGPVDILYTISDGEEQATASLRVTVQSKTAPVAVDDHYTVVAGETLDVPAPGVLGNDSDPDGDQLALISSTSPQHHASKATWIDGRIKYTPILGYTGPDSFTYTVTDWKGGESTATIYIDVVSPTPTNQAPIAVDDHYSVAAGQTLDVLAPGVLLNDTDPDGDPLTLETVHTGPGTGPLGNWATGRIQYKPKTGFIGTDTLTYIVSDGKGGTDTGTITITVTPAPVLPHAIDDAYQATSGKTLEIAAPGLLGNDVCNEPWTPTLNGAGDPLNGTLNWNADGSFTYTPDAGYVGEDGFGYQMSCGTGLYTGEVVITVGAAVSEEPGQPDGSDTPAPGTPAAQPNGDVLARTGSSAQPEMLLAAGIAILLGIIAAFGASRRRARR